MAILIADSGSTKTDWALTQKDKKAMLFETTGINPYILGSDKIKELLSRELIPRLGEIVPESLFFYAAGCSSEENQLKLKRIFLDLLPETKSTVGHDMLACALSLCENEPGIACILGTGSNACSFNGKEITDQMKALGYIAGDEGSGNHIGKMIFRTYFHRRMPKEIALDFERKFQPGTRNLVAELFAAERPNAYLASFAGFAGEHKEHPFIKEMLGQIFSDFLRHRVAPLEGAKDLPVHFTGSIAFHFSEILQHCLLQEGFIPGNIIRKPILGLINHHSET